MRSHPLIPHAFVDELTGRPAEGGPDGSAWLGDLPDLVDHTLTHWSLTATGPARTGWTALVLPVERDGVPYACKFGWPHHDSAGEALALRHWGGAGAVRLVAADPARGVLLLEALDPTRDLRGVPLDEACEVIGGLLARLHVPAPARVRRLSDVVAAELTALAGAPGLLPRRVVARAEGLFAELSRDPVADATLLHTDLHFENVLAGRRAGVDAEPWLAIDPNPMGGHPGYELHAVLMNRVDEYGTGAAFRWGVRRRVELVCDAAGIDLDVARHWSIVHAALQAFWSARDGDTDGTTLHLALLKALDD